MCWPSGRPLPAAEPASLHPLRLQAHYPATFSREHGCTPAEWLGWLPGAVRAQAWQRTADTQAVVQVGAGRLVIDWQALPPRQIALARLPRMQVHYAFEQVTDDERHAFMRYFDLFMQRGGG